jgi:hypothetical protein
MQVGYGASARIGSWRSGLAKPQWANAHEFGLLSQCKNAAATKFNFARQAFVMTIKYIV